MHFCDLRIGGSGMHFNPDNFWIHSSRKFLDHSIQDYVAESRFRKKNNREEMKRYH